MHTLRSRAISAALASTTAVILVMGQPVNAAVAIPPAIAVPAGNSLFLVGHARGYQVYGCQNAAWTLLYPYAGLFDDAGLPVATHYAGPSWQAPDHSVAVGTRVAGAPSPNGSIQWLLLSTTTSGPAGGVLLPTTFIQRLSTTGGVAPAGACANGATAAVYYTADYYFYRATTG